MHQNADVLQGTLDLLILKAVSLESMHGWGISQRIQQISSGVLEVNQGSLYPALHRLVKRRWLEATWGTSENNRRARFYKLTAVGKKQLVTETDTWRRFSGAVEPSWRQANKQSLNRRGRRGRGDLAPPEITLRPLRPLR